MVAVEREPLPPSGNAVGLDPGLASLAVTSGGVKIAPPTFLRAALRWIRRLQRSLSRKVKGSNDRAKVRFRRAKAHATVADQRLDPLHKLSTRLIREHQTVWIEDLNVAGMSRNRKLSKAIADAGWRLLRTLLAPKARMDGRTVQAVSRWEPTSRTCRDVNAACNILAAGLAERVNACGAESRSGWPPSGREAGTHLNRQVQRWIA